MVSCWKIKFLSVCLKLVLTSCLFLEEDMPSRGAQNATAESSGSQIPEHAIMYRSGDTLDQRAEPRVGLHTMGKLRAPRAKIHGRSYNGSAGSGSIASYTPTQKRAYKRAVRRATNSSQGGTWYKGRWLDLKQLGGPQIFNPVEQSLAKSTRLQNPPSFNRRLRAVTYNIGGFSTDAYDSFMQWLTQQDDFDVVYVQETHWGLGKEKENSWTTANWRVVASADPHTLCRSGYFPFSQGFSLCGHAFSCCRPWTSTTCASIAW